MLFDHRASAVQRLVREHVRSPSLRHIRDPHALEKLCVAIVQAVDQSGSVWQKWDGKRDEVLQPALDCWIPEDDLLAFLNALPGPQLTMTDLQQRMRHLIEDKYITTPEPELREGCRIIYAQEKAAGTEMPAIIGRLSQHVADESHRLWEERRQAEAQRLDDARQAREARLLSSADCPWTQIRGSRCWYCRKNGRLFRLTPAIGGTWSMHRVRHVDDEEDGAEIGRYRLRGDAGKVVQQAAYEPERRW